MASEGLKQVLGTHFKTFRQQLDFLATATTAFQREQQCSPFTHGQTAESHVDNVFPAVEYDYFETTLGGLVSSDTGGLNCARAGTSFAHLIAGQRIDDTDKSTSAGGNTSTHAVTAQHKALAVSVLRSTQNLPALQSFLQGPASGLKTIVKWLYISSSSKDPPTNLTLLQHILEWLTGLDTNKPTFMPSAPPPKGTQSSPTRRAIIESIDSSTANLLQELSRRSEKLFAVSGKEDRFIVGFDHAAQYPGGTIKKGSEYGKALEGLKSCVLFLYKQLFSQLGDKMPMQTLSSLTVKTASGNKSAVIGNPKSADSSPRGIKKLSPRGVQQNVPVPSSLKKRSAQSGSRSDGDSPRKIRTIEGVNSISGIKSSRGGSDMLSQLLGGKGLNKAQPAGKEASVDDRSEDKKNAKCDDDSDLRSNDEHCDDKSTEEEYVEKPNKKMLKRSGRQRVPVDDLLVIVPFSTGEKKLGAGIESDMVADTEHNASRRKIKWGDEAPDGVLLHTREFESLPPHEPSEVRRRGTKKFLLNEPAKDASGTVISSGDYGKKEKSMERENALQWREAAARQKLLARRREAHAVKLPAGAKWAKPSVVSLSHDQQLLAGTIEVDSKERKLQAQRIGLKIEICYFTEQEIPRDPETPSKSTHQQLVAQQGQSGIVAIDIPWENSNTGVAMDVSFDEQVDPSKQHIQESGSVKGDEVRGSNETFEIHSQSIDDPSIEKNGDDDLVNGLPEYVTVLDERQLEILLERLSHPSNAHLLEDCSHPGFLDLVGEICPAAKSLYLLQLKQENPAGATAERKSRFSDAAGAAAIEDSSNYNFHGSSSRSHLPSQTHHDDFRFSSGRANSYVARQEHQSPPRSYANHDHSQPWNTEYYPGHHQLPVQHQQFTHEQYGRQQYHQHVYDSQQTYQRRPHHSSSSNYSDEHGAFSRGYSHHTFPDQHQPYEGFNREHFGSGRTDYDFNYSGRGRGRGKGSY